MYFSSPQNSLGHSVPSGSPLGKFSKVGLAGCIMVPGLPGLQEALSQKKEKEKEGRGQYPRFDPQILKHK